MKYKGKEIGNPSIRQIKNCLRYLGKPLNKFSPEKIYKELEKKTLAFYKWASCM